MRYDDNDVTTPDGRSYLEQRQTADWIRDDLNCGRVFTEFGEKAGWTYSAKAPARRSVKRQVALIES